MHKYTNIEKHASVNLHSVVFMTSWFLSSGKGVLEMIFVHLTVYFAVAEKALKSRVLKNMDGCSFCISYGVQRPS